MVFIQFGEIRLEKWESRDNAYIPNLASFMLHNTSIFIGLFADKVNKLFIHFQTKDH